MSTFSGGTVPSSVTRQFGDLLNPSTPKEERIIEVNKFGIPEVKASVHKNDESAEISLPKDTNDITIKKENIEIKNSNKIDIGLNDGEILISTINCGIICKPKEVKVENKFFVIILTKEDSQKFVLYPGTKLHLEFKNINGKDSKFNIYYSGIRFEYNANIFMIFHEVSNNEI